MFHGATISEGELEQMRRIENVVRLGRVKAITPDAIELEQGTIPAKPGTVFVDCSASALKNQQEWRSAKELHQWIAGNRLEGPAKLLRTIQEGDVEKVAVVDRIRKNAPLAAQRLHVMLQETV